MNFVPNTDSQQERLLARIGVKSVVELFADIPEEVRLKRPLAIRGGMSEQELVKHVSGLAKQNKTAALPSRRFQSFRVRLSVSRRTSPRGPAACPSIIRPISFPFP